MDAIVLISCCLQPPSPVCWYQNKRTTFLKVATQKDQWLLDNHDFFFFSISLPLHYIMQFKELPQSWPFMVLSLSAYGITNTATPSPKENSSLIFPSFVIAQKAILCFVTKITIIITTVKDYISELHHTLDLSNNRTIH